MADSQRYKDWLDSAQKDLKGAKILYEYGGDYGIVAFHCQQAIEKSLKGHILKLSKDLKEGHSLVFLCKQAIQLDVSFRTLLKDCAYVNQFYIETRYPADIPLTVEKSEADECIRIAETIVGKVN